MAIMNCPECRKEMSDTLSNCPHCGFEISKGNNNSKKRIGILITLLIVIIAVVGSAAYGIKEKNETKWDQNCNKTAYAILMSCGDLSDVSTEISNVWYNSIFHIDDKKTNKYTKNNGVFYSDFNDSLDKLFDSKKFSEKYNKIINDKYTIDDYMLDLENPPDKYLNRYKMLTKLYDLYYNYYDSVININGKTYDEFGKDFTKADKAFYKKWNKVYNYFPINFDYDIE